MTLFNKGEVYTIIVDEDTNFWVQRFAENRCVKGTTIGVTKTDGSIVISFRTKESRGRIAEQLRSTFKSIYDVKVNEYLAFVTNKETR